MSVGLILLFAAAVGAFQPGAVNFGGNAAKQHAYTAEEAIACGMKHADIDRDGRLSLAEIKIIRDLAIRDEYSGIGVAIYHLASKIPKLNELISVKKIFADCDYDKDWFIDMKDFERMRATCLNKPEKIEDAVKWICDKGAAGVFKNAKL
jgi:hypothetical protein